MSLLTLILVGVTLVGLGLCIWQVTAIVRMSRWRQMLLSRRRWKRYP